MATGVFAMLWTVARACVQSLTIDEADTYLFWVRPEGPTHWTPHANNHVLNSMLMRLSTAIFGASAITLRLPALIGAALYIGAVYCLVRLITGRRLLQWGLFACLTLNPFVMDYLVAARGYSMASAFLLWMVVVAARYQARKGELWRTCALISMCAGLSICANFSFAIADGLTALGLFLWICRQHRREYGKILAAFLAPGLAVGYFIAGSVILAWPKSQLTWGATSLVEMTRSLVHACLYEPNEYLLHPRLRHYFVHFGTLLYPILAGLMVWRVAMLFLEKPAEGDETRIARPIAIICGSVCLGAIVCHEFLFLAYRIPLPLDRTALWVALLFLATAGALASPRLPSLAGRLSGIALTAILVLIGCYNIGCLRLTYFNEWKYDADMKNVYSVLASYNHTYSVTKTSTNWRYVGALNCYRLISAHETIEKIPYAPSVAGEYPAGYQAYVVYYPVDQDFVKLQSLQVVYHDEFSGAAVAIRPEILSK
jgi:hypothetical protein